MRKINTKITPDRPQRAPVGSKLHTRKACGLLPCGPKLQKQAETSVKRMFSLCPQDRPRMHWGHPFCAPGHPNEHPSDPKEAKGLTKATFGIPFSHLFVFFCFGCRLGSRREAERLPAPYNSQNATTNNLLYTKSCQKQTKSTRESVSN